jgi:YHS domain-containing protein
MSRLPVRLAAVVLSLAPLLSLVACGGTETATAETMAKASAAAGSANGLCPVMERLVTTDGGSVEYKGQKIAFCCPGCVGTFNKNPEKWMGAMKANPAKFGYKP